MENQTTSVEEVEKENEEVTEEDLLMAILESMVELQESFEKLRQDIIRIKAGTF